MDGDDLLLLMQFPAGEIGRKVALTVTPHVDDNDVTTPDKFHAREFPVGTGMFEYFWYRQLHEPGQRSLPIPTPSYQFCLPPP